MKKIMFNLGIRSGKQFITDTLNESLENINLEDKSVAEKKGILKGADFINKLSEEFYEDKYKEKERNINKRIDGLKFSYKDREAIKRCYGIYKRTNKHRIRNKQFQRTRKIIDKYEGIKVINSYTLLIENEVKNKYKTVTVVYVEGKLSDYDLETLKNLAFLYNVNFHSLKIELKPEDPEGYKGTVKEAMAEKAKGSKNIINNDTIKGIKEGFSKVESIAIERAVSLDSLGYKIAIKYPITEIEGREIASMMIKNQILLGYSFEEAEEVISELLDLGYSVEEINLYKNNLKEILDQRKLCKALALSGEKALTVSDRFNDLMNKITKFFKKGDKAK